jgi:hypothetical protein
VWEIGLNHYFIKFSSKNFTIEQIWVQFYSAILCLKDIGVLRILKFEVLRVPSIQIPTQNGQKWKFFYNKFHRGINLVALLFSNSGSRNKITFSEFGNLKGTSIQNLEVEGLLRIVSDMWKVFTHPTCASDFFKTAFYFPHMKYGKYWFHLQKKNFFLLQIFKF